MMNKCMYGSNDQGRGKWVIWLVFTPALVPIDVKRNWAVSAEDSPNSSL